MGEIRIVGPGKTRGYPCPVCKNRRFGTVDQMGVNVLRVHVYVLGIGVLKVDTMALPYDPLADSNRYLHQNHGGFVGPTVE